MSVGYTQWLHQRSATLLRGADVAQTARGPVEVQRRGAAPYLLHVHGGGGGYDTSFLSDPLLDAGYGCLSPSRPGNGRTPLNTGRSYPEQADAMAALLDALGVDRVALHGISAGGPVAIHFAARHPHRTRALLLSSAIATTYDFAWPWWTRRAAVSNLASWWALRLSETHPRVVVREVLKLVGTYSGQERERVVEEILATPESLSLFRRLMESATPAGSLEDGFLNDIEQYEEIREHGLPLTQVRCPTLVVHGTADREVPFSHAETACQQIADAILHAMEGASHLLWLSDGAAEMYRVQTEFLRAHLD